TETLARVVQEEKALHEYKEDVEPWPLARVAIETEPEMQREQHADYRHGANEEPQDDSNAERKLCQNDERITERDTRGEDADRDPLLNTERGVLCALPRPTVESAGNRQRQFPQRTLEPHGADKETHRPRGEMLRRALRRILAPVRASDPDACRDE